MVIFLCEDHLAGILCGVYDAWTSKLGHSNVKLGLKNYGNLELFAESREVKVNQKSFEKVERAIIDKISEEAYDWIYKASLSWEEGKADWIYRFLIYGFHYGKSVSDLLQVPAVHEIFRMNRHISNEVHLLTGFLRFSEVNEGILLAEIGPKNNVLSLLAPHFAARFEHERWIIYDEKRKQAAVFSQETGWFLIETNNLDWKRYMTEKDDEKSYQNLWGIVYESIAIKERKNKVCQRSHLPLRYRSYMTEFQNRKSD